MRVLQLNIHYSGTGADRCARELYEGLPSVGIDSAMWVGDPSPFAPSDVRVLRKPWEPYLMPLETLPDLTDWRHRGTIEALKGIPGSNFDLVHFHILHSGWISIRAVRELTEKIPCVWTLHDEWAPNLGVTCDLTQRISPAEAKALSRGAIRYIPYHRYHDNYKWRRTRRFLKRFLPQPRAVVCPSEYMATMARRANVFANSEVLHIPNGTRMSGLSESTFDRAEARRAIGIDPELPTALLVSADLAQAHKGIALGIEAIEFAAKKTPIQLVLLGKSSAGVEKRLSSIKYKSLQSTDDKTLAKIYRGVDITLMPSLAENFPYVAIESLACETPIVAFPVGGMPEIIGADERGLICSKLSSVEMGERIVSLLSNRSKRTTMGATGRAWVIQNCDMHDYLRKIADLYKRIIAGEKIATGASPIH